MWWLFSLSTISGWCLVSVERKSVGGVILGIATLVGIALPMLLISSPGGIGGPFWPVIGLILMASLTAGAGKFMLEEDNRGMFEWSLVVGGTLLLNIFVSGIFSFGVIVVLGMFPNINIHVTKREAFIFVVILYVLQWVGSLIVSKPKQTDVVRSQREEYI